MNLRLTHAIYFATFEDSFYFIDDPTTYKWIPLMESLNSSTWGETSAFPMFF
jgi:hypothetical protein